MHEHGPVFLAHGEPELALEFALKALKYSAKAKTIQEKADGR